MRHRITALAVVIALAAAAPSRAPYALAQDAQDEEGLTRGAFFATRPIAQSVRPKPVKPKPKPKRSGGDFKGGAEPMPLPPPPPPKGPNNTKPREHKGGANTTAAPARIALGYTIFLCDADKTARERVAPDRKFAKGEGIRIALETNTDGYLYIFNDDGAQVQMLYPHGRLDGGENEIYAHVPRQIPAADDRRCMEFTDNSRGVERLYIVVAREPLAGVPDADALVKNCGAGEGACEWAATPVVRARIEGDAKERVLVSRNDELLGKSLSEGERKALTRGLTLSKAEPAPAVIRMNASPAAPALVTSIDLVHK